MSCRVLEKGITRVTYPYGKNGHGGVDLGHKVWHEGILAHTAGKVVSVASGHKNNTKSTGTASYGNYVRIDHGKGYSTLYAHLDKVCVKVGQTVSTGQKIGTMGNTGNSYGEHLHFEVRNNNIRINPTQYIEADLPALSTEKPAQAAATSAKNKTPHKITVHEAALEVIKGKLGNGLVRRVKIVALGLSYTAVQAEVKRLLKR